MPHTQARVGANHSHSLRILLIRSKLNLERFFTRAATLWNKLPQVFFPDHYTLKILKSEVNLYLSYISSCNSYVHKTKRDSVNIYYVWSLDIVLGEQTKKMFCTCPISSILIYVLFIFPYILQFSTWLGGQTHSQMDKDCSFITILELLIILFSYRVNKFCHGL